MSEWKKVEKNVEKPVNPADKQIDKTSDKKMALSQDIDTEIHTPQMSVETPRYVPHGRRRGRNSLAAPLGFIVLLLAVVGFVSIIIAGIRAVEHARDDTELREELYDFLLPVMQYNPEAFTDVNKTKQDALLLAAIWRVTEAERIRQLIDGSGVSNYAIDDSGRMMIPIEEIDESYAYLFGEDAIPYHHTIGDEGKSFTVEYDKDNGNYHVPNTSTSLYVTVIDSLKKKKDKIMVRVGYVLSTKIGRDEKGELVDPTPDMAEKFQVYTVQKTSEDGWKLISITDEKSGSKSSRTSQLDDSDLETEKFAESEEIGSAVSQSTASNDSASTTKAA
ncbi:MAG: hypothetical protein PHX02_05645 [Oscillospiraceae bacterium]|nr:hypothetical protein [Oscillospiraceae bacterium]